MNAFINDTKIIQSDPLIWNEIIIKNRKYAAYITYNNNVNQITQSYWEVILNVDALPNIWFNLEN